MMLNGASLSGELELGSQGCPWCTGELGSQGCPCPWCTGRDAVRCLWKRVSSSVRRCRDETVLLMLYCCCGGGAGGVTRGESSDSGTTLVIIPLANDVNALNPERIPPVTPSLERHISPIFLIPADKPMDSSNS